jgi:hypothetical protein
MLGTLPSNQEALLLKQSTTEILWEVDMQNVKILAMEPYPRIVEESYQHLNNPKE